MARKRYIDIYYNVVDGVLQDSTGVELASSLTPYIYYQEKPMVRLQLVIDSSNTPYTELSESSGDYTVSIVIDNDFSSDTAPYCRTIDSSINVAGEWKSDGNADIGQGEFSIPLDGNNTDFNSRIGTSRAKTDTLFEIQLRDAGDSTIIASFRFPFYCLGLMDKTGGVPTGAATINYYTKAEVDALFDADSSSDSGVYLKLDGSNANVGINIGNESITTTGIVTAGRVGIDNLTIDGASILSSTGAISFSDDSLVTTGAVTAGSATINGNITLENDEVIDNSADGTIRFEGQSDVYTTGFEIDFATSTYGTYIRGTTSRDGNKRITIDGTLGVADNAWLQVGSSYDVNHGFNTTGYDTYMTNMRMPADVATSSGFWVFQEYSSARHPAFGNLPQTNNPTFRIQAPTTTLADFIQFYHDGTDGNIEVGSGDLVLSPADGVSVGGDMTMQSGNAFFPRQVTTSTDMDTDVAGTEGEIVYCTTDSIFYGCQTTGAAGAAVWAAFHA